MGSRIVEYYRDFETGRHLNREHEGVCELLSDQTKVLHATKFNKSTICECSSEAQRSRLLSTAPV